MKRFFFYVFVGFAKVVAFLPLRVLYILSDMLYPIVYYLVRYRKKVVFENLRNAFPEKSEKEIEEIAKKFYHHFCDILIEILKLFNISPKEMKKRMRLKDPDVFNDDFEKKKNILVVIGHYNNWEWGCSLGMHMPYQAASIYKPLTNKLFDDLMIRLRTQFGAEVVPMAKTSRWLIKQIQDGKPIQLTFIADQSPYHTEIQYWTNFLNQDTPVFLGIEKLALKTKNPVYFASFIKIKRGYYEVEIEKLCDDCNELPLHELTERHVRALEKLIRTTPQHWLWSHRRWKNKRTKLTQ
jgi:Kdo2-lipid IVA lauroyltransferase/acyltransferase